MNSGYRTRAPYLIAGTLLLLLGFFHDLQAEWPEFRGPNQDGIAPGNLPTEWSEDKNITWRREVHGQGWSTPLVLEGKIWLTTASKDGTLQSVLCFDEKNGDLLLDRVLITNDNPEPLSNPINSYASSTGVIEKGRVYLHFGSYGTICLDTENFEPLWQRRDITCSHWRGPASSLCLHEEKVILTLEGADQQYFLALDKNTGKTLWRRDRSTDFKDEKDGIPANSGDMRKSYSTPIFVNVGDRTQMICNGAKAAWAYDVQSGEEIWHVSYSTHSPSSRPVYSKELNTVFLNTGLGKAEVWAVQLDPKATGDISSSHMQWKLIKRTPKRASPVLANGLLFMANDGVGSCVDPATGEIHWTERIGGDYSASLLATGEHVYFCDEEGLCTVIKASSKFERIAENHLDAGFMASPAASGDSLVLRTKTHLYRIDD